MRARRGLGLGGCAGTDVSGFSFSFLPLQATDDSDLAEFSRRFFTVAPLSSRGLMSGVVGVVWCEGEDEMVDMNGHGLAISGRIDLHREKEQK